MQRRPIVDERCAVPLIAVAMVALIGFVLALFLAPGAEVSNLARCLWVFARAVLEPDSEEGPIAEGATTYAASAWSRDIGYATGAIQRPLRGIGGTPA